VYFGRVERIVSLLRGTTEVSLQMRPKNTFVYLSWYEELDSCDQHPHDLEIGVPTLVHSYSDIRPCKFGDSGRSAAANRMIVGTAMIVGSSPLVMDGRC
jgi:hypothetical protein